jgi:DNA-binding IscR family transcriptional regulator
MKRDSRLSGMLHVLLHMAGQEGPITSEHLAEMMHTNPVVVRRIMTGLRARGHVRSEKGHGGGWRLATDPGKLTLYDVYEALGRPPFFAIGNRSDAPLCLVEQAVNGVLDQALDEAAMLLHGRLRKVTLAMLSADFHRRHAPHSPSHPAAKTQAR